MAAAGLLSFASVVSTLHAIGVASSNSDEYSERYKLTRELLRNYDRFQVPTKNSAKPVNVTMTMWPYDILHVNEARSSIKFSGWLDLRWIDYHMQWKPEEHGNLTHLFIPASKLWLPSVDIFYRKDERHAKRCNDCYIKVDSNGETLWGQYFSFTFPCTINIKYLPFDIQYCEMELANWYLDDRMMDLYPTDSTVALDLSVFLPNVEWELLNVTVTRKRGFFNYGYFASVAYRLHIKRKPFFYVAVFVIPSIVITLTSVIGFHLPSSGSGVHEEKVQMGVTAVLSLFILQLGVADRLPPSSNIVPLIGIYYSCTVMILSLSIVSSAFIIVIEKQGIYGKPIPDIIQLVVLWRRQPSRHAIETKPQHVLIGPRTSGLNKNNTWGHMRREVSANFSNYDATIQNEFQSNGDSNAGLAEISRRLKLAQENVSRQLDTRGLSSNPKVAPINHTKDTVLSDLSESLHRTLSQIRASVAALDRRLAQQERKWRIRRDWSTLADVVERISLVFFLCATFVALLMFFYHDWY